MLNIKNMLQVETISKFFGAYQVLENVGCEVIAGEVVAIIAPSGSGKSTLLQCINQLEPPTSGRIIFDDIIITAGQADISNRNLLELRRRLGMVFQSFNLFPHLSVPENVSLAQRRVLGRSKSEADAQSRELLERVGVGDKASLSPVRCSGGQQQCIAIARALGT